MFLVMLCVGVAIPKALYAESGVCNTATELGQCSNSIENERGGIKVLAEEGYNGGVRLGAMGTAKMWEGDDSRLDVNAHISKTFGGVDGPPTIGGGVTYEHQRASAALDVSHNPDFGTNVAVEGRANIWRSDDNLGSFDASARWSRSYGGYHGTSRPNYGFGVVFTRRF